MMRSVRWPVAKTISTISLVLVLAGCDNGVEEKAQVEVEDASATTENPAVVQPGPVTGTEALPPGHPPFEGMEAAAPTPAPVDPTAALPMGHPPMPDVGGGEQVSEESPLHPVPSSEKELAINLPDDVKGRWLSVGIEAELPDGNAQELEVTIGGETSMPESGLILRVEAFVPSYKSDFKTITSASGMLDNPAAKIALIDGGEVVAKGWVFQNLPEFNSFTSERLKVRLVSAKEAGEATQ
ncbi:MAG: hypothetical protein JRF02_06325 [Deltaproteobacteria bacterium]|nr:hypothetical protein [Deltaproteobacteria bacterium]